MQKYVEVWGPRDMGYGLNITCLVKPSDSVEEILTRLEDKLKFPSSRIRLFYKNINQELKQCFQVNDLINNKLVVIISCTVPHHVVGFNWVMNELRSLPQPDTLCIECKCAPATIGHSPCCHLTHCTDCRSKGFNKDLRKREDLKKSDFTSKTCPVCKQSSQGQFSV